VSGTGVSGTGVSGTGVSGTGVSGTGVSGIGVSGTGVSGIGVSGTGVSVHLGPGVFGVFVGVGGSGVLVGGTGVKVFVGRSVGVLVGRGVLVGIGVGVLFGSPPPWCVLVNCIGVLEGVGVEVEFPEIGIMAVSVSVAVGKGVLEGRVVSAKTATDVNVGVKKRVAKASRVSALSRGVAVAVCRGSRTMSGRVSGFPPLIMKGKLNARTTVPRIARIIKEPLAFVFICLFSIQ
jgi:hypothetical protein